MKFLVEGSKKLKWVYYVYGTLLEGQLDWYKKITYPSAPLSCTIEYTTPYGTNPQDIKPGSNVSLCLGGIKNVNELPQKGDIITYFTCP